MLRLTAITALCVTAVMAGIAHHAGMFDTLEITREQYGPFNLIYREHRGSYKAVRVIMNNVYRYVRDTLHLKTSAGFAVFYDNRWPEEDTLRSIAGVIVDDSLMSLPPPYKTGSLGRAEALVGRFPMRGFFSYATGSYKFYEALSRLNDAQKINRRGPVIEIYETERRSLRFIRPADNAAAFVPSFSGN